MTISILFRFPPMTPLSLVPSFARFFMSAATLGCALLGLTLSAQHGAVVARLDLSNPSDFVRTDEIINLSLAQLGVEADVALTAFAEGEPLRSQAWDADGDGKNDTFSIVSDFVPHGAIMVEVRRGAGARFEGPDRVQAEISRKTGGAWEGREYIGGTFENVRKLSPPEGHTDHSWFIRYEGPGWESDKVGYRFYLDWRNGFDIFGKTTTELVLQDVGQDGFDSYHELHDWGMDILKVGDAIGVGGFGHWNGESLERVSEVAGWETEITANGPVWAQIRTLYKDWNSSAGTTRLTSQLRIGVGSRITWVDLDLEDPVPHMATGLVKLPEGERIEGPTDIPMLAWSYLATYGEQTLNGDDLLGMAILFRKPDFREFNEDAHNHLVVLRPDRSQLEYGFLAAWEREPDGITSRDEFLAYLDETIERLNRPIRVRMKTAAGLIESEPELTAERVGKLTERLVDSVIERRGHSLFLGEPDPESKGSARWRYTTGLLTQAIYDSAGPLARPDFAAYGKALIDSYLDEDGNIATYRPETFNVDQVNSGKMLLRLSADTGDRRYEAAAARIWEQLVEHPRTSQGAFWHKQIYPHQVWLDGVYMAVPFLAGHVAAFDEDPEHFEEAVNEFEVVYEHLRDPATGLYYHAWDESREQAWSDPETGLSEEFWGRGLGWYAMAIVDTIELLPDDHPGREILKGYLRELAAALVQVQDAEAGVWYQVLDKPEGPGNYLEASGSSMFVYTLAKGIRKGWLDDSYTEATLRGYRGMLEEFLRVEADGSLSVAQICQVAGLGFGRDGSYAYYMNEPIVVNDPKGVGPFILAGLEVAGLLEELD